jgi:hypothetical protein
MKTLKIVLLGFIFLLTSCASVMIYSDAALQNKTGIKFYTSKPYLLVQYGKSHVSEVAKDAKSTVSDSSSVKITVVYLPDLVNPQYLKFKSGMGSSELKVSLSNSILTSYGLATDTKIPETITATGGLVTALAAALKPPKAENIVAKTEVQPDFELYEIVMDNGLTSLKKVGLK